MDPIQRGKVTRATAAGLFVSVPALGGGDKPAESFTPTPPAVGDRVLVALINGSIDDLAIIGAQS